MAQEGLTRDGAEAFPEGGSRSLMKALVAPPPR